jgi:hypothetical protein
MALEMLGDAAGASPAYGVFVSVTGQVPAVSQQVLLGPSSSNSAALQAYFAEVHRAYLELNSAIAKLASQGCWSAASTRGWIATRDAWAALYSKGATAANLPLAKQFAQKLLAWRDTVFRSCRAAEGLRLSWGDGITYVLTQDDLLWLKRMVQAEVRPGVALEVRAAEAKRVAQTMLNWFGFAKRQGKYRGFTLRDAIRSYSEPMKPTAKEAGQLFAQARTSFRPEIEEGVRVSLTRGPVDIATGTVQWGAPGFNEDDPAKVMTYPGKGSANREVNRYYAQKNSLTFPGYRVG